MSVTSTTVDIEREAGASDVPRVGSRESVGSQRIDITGSLPLDNANKPDLSRRSTRDDLKVLFYTSRCMTWF
jgi:hypothetical protein